MLKEWHGDFIHSILYITSFEVSTSKSAPSAPFPEVASCTNPHTPWVHNGLPIFHQPDSLVPVTGTTTHPPRPEVGFILNQPPIPPLPDLLLRVSILHGDVLFSLLLHTQTILHTAPRQTFPKHRPNQDPALHTCKTNLTPPGKCSLVTVGRRLKLDFTGQLPPCQFHISVGWVS